MDNSKPIRVRFAPSPTGELHIGGLRTALTDFLFARKNGGKFILRIEDTDQKRFVKGSVERIIKSLEWAGIEIDEGAVINEQITVNSEQKIKNRAIKEKGDYRPYTQSKRLDIYKKYVQKLLDKNKAYYCFCSPERLGEMRKKQQKNKQAPMYDRSCLKLSQ